MPRNSNKLIIDLLNKSNFIDKHSLNKNGITKEEVQKFCNKYKLYFKAFVYGAWAGIQFVDENGNTISGEYFKERGEGNGDKTKNRRKNKKSSSSCQ